MADTVSRSPAVAGSFGFVSDSIFIPSVQQFVTDPAVCIRRLPERSTAGSAGYDLFAPFGFELAPMKSIIIPTGIRALIYPGWFLMIAPRSGLGTRFRLRLDNTVGIIDSDYSSADNEGHILIKLTNESTEGKTLSVASGTAFAQGIFIPFGITEDDCADGERHGGFGSTGQG